MSRNDESRCILDKVTDRRSLCYANTILAWKKKGLEKVFIEKIIKYLKQQRRKRITSHIKKKYTGEKEAERRDPILTYTRPCDCEGQYIKKWLETS